MFGAFVWFPWICRTSQELIEQSGPPVLSTFLYTMACVPTPGDIRGRPSLLGFRISMGGGDGCWGDRRGHYLFYNLMLFFEHVDGRHLDVMKRSALGLDNV